MVLGLAMVCSLTACKAEQKDLPTERNNPPADEKINVGEISEEKVMMNEKLAQVEYEEGEDQVSPFYKRGTSKEGTACYLVRLAGETADMEIPMDNTVIYTMDEGESYLEQIAFSMEIDGEKMEIEQYRIYVNPAQD